MRSSKRWLAALSLAWAGTVLLVLLPGAQLLAAAWLIAWLGFAACFLSRSARRRALASLIALLLPLQGFAGVSFETRGPAHVHAGALPHSHHHVEHHHHSIGTDAVTVEEGRRFSDSVVLGEAKRLDAAPAAIFAPDFGLTALRVRAVPDSAPDVHSPPPHEHPPRLAFS